MESRNTLDVNQIVRQLGQRTQVDRVGNNIATRIRDRRPLPMGPAAPNKPNDVTVYTVPPLKGIPTRDGTGRPLGYCAWNVISDSDITEPETGAVTYLGGLTGNAKQLTFAVISGGRDGRIDTSCSDILTRFNADQPEASGDDLVYADVSQDAASSLFAPSVATLIDLNNLPSPEVNEVRLVEESNTLYTYARDADGDTPGNQPGWLPIAGAGGGSGFVQTVPGELNFDGQITVDGLSVDGLTNLTGNTTITGSLSVTTSVTADTFVGDGSGISDLNAGQITTGVVDPARGGTGIDGSGAAQGALLIGKGDGTGFALGALGAGAGLSVVVGAGTIDISNTGVLSITGTPDQIVADVSTGDITLSLPQNIATTSVPTFAGLNITGDATVTGLINGATVRMYADDHPDADSGDNFAFGSNVLAGLQKGTANIAIGQNVLNNVDQTTNIGTLEPGGRANIGIGNSALASMTNGHDNIAIGYEAMMSNTWGTDNTAVGNSALRSSTMGIASAAFGLRALQNTTTGRQNTAIGAESMNSNVTGQLNVAVGYESMPSNVDGNRNAVLGTLALWSLTSGDENIAIGDRSFFFTGGESSRNTGIGVNAFHASVDSFANSGVGYDVMRNNRLGHYLSGLGAFADVTLDDLNYATAIGAYSRVSSSDTVVLGALGSNKAGTLVNDQIVIGATARDDTYANTVLYVDGVTNLNGDVHSSGTITANAFAGDGSGLTNLDVSNLSGIIDVANGGTGVDGSAAANGSLLIGNGTGYSLGTLTAGAGIGIANGAGSITISNTGVTSLTGTANQIVASAASGDITLSLPQDIAAASTPTFGGLTLTGGVTGTTAGFSELTLTGALTGTTANFSGVVSMPSLDIGEVMGTATDPNIRIGLGAMSNPQAGEYGQRNTAIGIDAMRTIRAGSDDNTAVGYNALEGALSAKQTAIGAYALNLANSTGATAIGYAAMQNAAGSAGSVAVGQSALENASGLFNVAVGATVLRQTTTGDRNAAMGYNALTANTTGRANVAIGNEALFSTISSIATVGIGSATQATGNYATVVGAGANATTRDYASSFGANSRVNTDNTVVLGALGVNKVSAISTTDDQVVIGATARNDTYANTLLYVNGVTNLNGDVHSSGTITANAFAGDGSGLTNLDVSNLSGIIDVANGGTGVDGSAAANGSLLIGNGTGYSLGTLTAGAGIGIANGAGSITISNTGVTSLTGTANQIIASAASGDITLSLPQDIAAASTPTFGGLTLTGGVTGTTAGFSELTLTGALAGTTANFSGVVSMPSLDIGEVMGSASVANIRIGNGSMSTSLDGEYGEANTAIGIEAMETIDVNATFSTAVGFRAMETSTANFATAVGALALQNGSANSTTAIGYAAMRNAIAASDSTAVGFAALQSSEGDRNTAVGNAAQRFQTTGVRNSSLGFQTLYNNLTGSHNTSAGYFSLRSATAGQHMVGIGAFSEANGSYSSAIGSNANAGTTNYSTVVGAYALATTQNTVVLGALGANKDGVVSSADDQVVIGATGRDNTYGNTKLYISGNVHVDGTVNMTAENIDSDIRLKKDIVARTSDQILSALEQIGVYSYVYRDNPELGRRIGVIAQEVMPILPEVVTVNDAGFMAVDYNALGAMAAAGVGKLSADLRKLEEWRGDAEAQLTEHADRLAGLENWKDQTNVRLDGVDKALEQNLARIVDNAARLASNTEELQRLDSVLLDLSAEVDINTAALAKMKEQWDDAFLLDGATGTVTVVPTLLKAKNFTAEQIEAQAVYAEMIQAEIAEIRQLEVDDLRANTAQANTLQAQQVNTGSTEVFVSAGALVPLFAASSDGHYSVTVSAMDGSHATATVIVAGGLARIVDAKSEGIELTGAGNQVQVSAAGKMVRASWLKTG